MSTISVMIEDLNENFEKDVTKIRHILDCEIVTSTGATRIAEIALHMARNRQEVDRLTILAGGTLL